MNYAGCKHATLSAAAADAAADAAAASKAPIQNNTLSVAAPTAPPAIRTTYFTTGHRCEPLYVYIYHISSGHQARAAATAER